MAFSSELSLIGPPILSKSPPTSPTSTKETTLDPFIALLDAGFGAKTNKPEPKRGFTENGSGTFLSSGNRCVDFFFQVVPTTPSSRVVSLLTAAWKHDPLTALKLLCHLRGVRGTGKSDKERFYAGALWLHRNHPKTLALNVASFAEFGYMKDLLEILFRLLHGDEVREEMKDELLKSRATKTRACIKVSRPPKRVKNPNVPSKATVADFVAVNIAQVQKKNSIEKAEFAVADPKPESKEETVQKKVPNTKYLNKQKKIISLAKKALDQYTSDSKYRFLFYRVAEFFAAMLTSDLKQLNSGKIKKIGLAAKWCPSLDKSFDRSTLLCEAIARIMFPRNAYPEYEVLSEQQYVLLVRNRLRREVLVPIRKVLKLPEVYMSAQRWADLPYSRVASVAMKRYKKLFKKHDKERFEEYLTKVEEGKAKISAGALLPHEIAAPAYRGEDDKVADLQWKRMVDDLLEKGTLSNCIAVCDVSGSMEGTPMEVCVALGVLVSELSEEPWKGKVITFHGSPSIQIIRGISLKEKMSFVKSMEWGRSTNFQGVFNRILDTAVQAQIKPEQMVKKVFVFSDMEFNDARGRGYHHWETESGSETEFEAETESGSESESEEETESGSETDSEEETESGSEIEFEAETESGSETGSEEETESGSETDSEESVEETESLEKTKPESETEYETATESQEESEEETHSEEETDFEEEIKSEVKTEYKGWETDYEVIRKKFEAKGYGDVVPEIVFWNLRDSRSTPVTANQKGAAFVSGFSKNSLKIFLEGKTVPTPEDVMMEAISGEEYQKLTVFD